MGQICSGGSESTRSTENLRNTSSTQSQARPRPAAPPKQAANNNQVMGNSAIKQHHETAKKTGVLKLSHAKLTEFPPNLSELQDILRTLDLSENRFTEIPDGIGSFHHLKHMNFNKNKLTFLPEIIGQLSKLESLSVCSNRLTELPHSLSNLSHLKQVNLSDNHITVFPLMFNGLTHLDALDLSRNRITVIPDGASDLRVTELNLNQNRIATISEKLADCPRLKTLRLEENCLQVSAIHPRILTDSKVSILALEGNLFDMKSFSEANGYDAYMDRYTAVKKKMF